MRYFLFLVVLLCIACQAQEPLVSFDEEIIRQIDAFGLEQVLLLGKIRNDSEDAYANINVYADLLNADGEVIGETRPRRRNDRSRVDPISLRQLPQQRRVTITAQRELEIVERET